MPTTDNHNKSLYISPILVLAAAVLAIVFLYSTSQQNKPDLEEFALGRETSGVYGTVNGEPVHCRSLTDIETCIGPAQGRSLEETALWLGNSQLHAINQFQPGQEPASAQLARTLRSEGIDLITFSQPNANLSEHFLAFEAIRKLHGVDYLILPLVFDDTRETGIRPDIAKVANKMDLRSAIRDTPAGEQIISQLDQAGEAEPNETEGTLQDHSESLITDALEDCCGWQSLRKDARGSIHIGLYRLRNTAFNITPSSARRKIPATYATNIAAYRSILATAQQAGVEVLTYIAPLRSDVSIPYIANEYAAFKTEAQRIADQTGARFIDLEDLVPATYWGSKDATSLGGEAEIDFMHFQEPGHRLLANRLVELLQRPDK